jgi:hypothetical protein
MQTTPDLESRQQLAVSIHRALRREIPERAPEDELKTSIDAALLEEAQRNELTLAYLRAAATAALAMSFMQTPLRPP